jgi:hypothetical protein
LSRRTGLLRIGQRIKQNRWKAKSEGVNNTVKSFNAIRRKAGAAKSSVHNLRRPAITNWAKRPNYGAEIGDFKQFPTPRKLLETLC